MNNLLFLLCVWPLAWTQASCQMYLRHYEHMYCTTSHCPINRPAAWSDLLNQWVRIVSNYFLWEPKINVLTGGLEITEHDFKALVIIETASLPALPKVKVDEMLSLIEATLLHTHETRRPTKSLLRYCRLVAHEIQASGRGRNALHEYFERQSFAKEAIDDLQQILNHDPQQFNEIISENLNRLSRALMSRILPENWCTI